jgi:hypothetical protein
LPIFCGGNHLHFRTACHLVDIPDAARIDPDVIKPASLGLAPCALDRCAVLGRGARGEVVEGLEVDLFAILGVGKNGKAVWGRLMNSCNRNESLLQSIDILYR